MTPEDVDRWTGDGDVAIITALGGSFTAYGVDGEDLGWADGVLVPTELACNPHGAVQAGVHAVLLDASMNVAVNAALGGRDRTEATIEMTTEFLAPARLGGAYTMRGEVVRLTRRIAFAEGTVAGSDGEVISRATGTFLVHRADD